MLQTLLLSTFCFADTELRTNRQKNNKPIFKSNKHTPFRISQTFKTNSTFDYAALKLSLSFSKGKWMSLAPLWGNWRVLFYYDIVGQSEMFDYSTRTFFNGRKCLNNLKGDKSSLPPERGHVCWHYIAAAELTSIRSVCYPERLYSFKFPFVPAGRLSNKAALTALLDLVERECKHTRCQDDKPTATGSYIITCWLAANPSPYSFEMPIYIDSVQSSNRRVFVFF